MMVTVLLVGCQVNSDNHFNAKAVASAALAKAVLTEHKSPEVVVECDGSGYIIHGDGHRTTCPGCKNCKDKGALVPPVITKPIEIVMEEPIVVKKHCNCGGGCKDCQCTNQEECTLNVRLLSNGNVQVCNKHGCRIYLGYNNARNRVMRTRQNLLVACEVDKRELLKLADQARREGKLFCVRLKADDVIKQGVHTFSAP